MNDNHLRIISKEIFDYCHHLIRVTDYLLKLQLKGISDMHV